MDDKPTYADIANIREEPELHYLSEKSILLYQLSDDEKPHPPKPPPSLKELITDCYVTILPKIPEDIKEISLPYVREIGIKASIAHLAPYFNCNDFENNLVEFWFLDMIVDCIWRAQDEFRFPSASQKCILEWLLFIFTLLSNTDMTKEKLFEIFNEAMQIAEDYVESGGQHQPSPKILFNLKIQNNEEIERDVNSNISSYNSSSIINVNKLNYIPSKQYIIIKINEEFQIFKLPTKSRTVDCMSSSEDSASERGISIPISNNINELIKANNIEESSQYSVDFAKVNMATPPRFKSLQDIDKISSESTVQNAESSESTKSSGDWQNIPRKPSLPPCPSKLLNENFSLGIIDEKQELESPRISTPKIIQNQSSTTSEEKIELNNEEILKMFYNYNLWLLKNEYMENPKLGWNSLSSIKNLSFRKTKLENIPDFIKTSFRDEKDAFIKSCVLMAVRQLVYDYFGQSFAFEIAKLSLTNPQYLITQDINTDWNIPKEIKGDFKKPVPKKPKKPKKEKAKKEKKSKDKSSKKSSKSSKKDKKSSKGKKDKHSKKSDKKSSKSSKSAKTKLSKEDKKEMDRQKKEQEELEKELRKEAENKMYMFPLKEAVNDDFFLKLFPNYKPKKAGGKKEKSDKSSKSSKKSKKTK